MVKNVLKLIMLLLPFSFLVVNCTSYQIEKYNPNQRYKSPDFTNKNNRIRKDVAQHAQRFIGSPYKYAGTTPKGFDCSGFTSYVLKEYVNIPRSSIAQAETGAKIELTSVKPGDLIFFSKTGKGRISHVALVVDNTKEGIQVVHSTTSRGVIVENISTSRYWKPKIKYARDVLIE